MTGLFQTLANVLDLTEEQSTALWEQVTRARFTVTRQWHHDLLYFDQQPMPLHMKLDAVLPFFQQSMPPARLCEVFECMQLEGLVSRAEASSLEERVLELTDSQGCWFWKNL